MRNLTLEGKIATFKTIPITSIYQADFLNNTCQKGLK